MQFSETKLPAVFLLTPDVREDNRGFFMELYRKDAFLDAGLPISFVQINQSHSKKGVVRGLHLQWDPPLGKLIRVVHGTAFFAVVDARASSPNVGKWITLELSSDNKQLLFVPPGFASGFCVMSDEADVEYGYTALYNPQGEGSILWNDPTLGIPWPVTEPIVSPRDASAISFAEWRTRPEASLSLQAV